MGEKEQMNSIKTSFLLPLCLAEQNSVCLFVCLADWKVLQSEITLNVAVVPHKPFEVATFLVSFSS